MANIATTVFKVMGTRDAVTNLYEAMKSLQKDNNNILLGDLANYYGIDHKTRGISVRGNIFTFDYEEDSEVDYYLLSFETESAWDAPFEVIEAISKVLNDELEINYRVIECGCDLFYVHQESAIDFFPEECCVSTYGDPFEESCEDVYLTVEDAIMEWCSATGNPRGEMTAEEMINYINAYEYDAPDTYFYINEIEHD